MNPDQAELKPALSSALTKATEFFESLDSRRSAAPFQQAAELPLSEAGMGAEQAIDLLWRRYSKAFSGSSGPRYWGFVNGGATPAAIAADWLCSVVDQTGQMFGDSPGVAIEHETMGMLRELFGLPPEHEGMFVSGGSMANYTGLAICLQRLGTRVGVNVSRDGARALPPVHVLTGECHSSITRACGMLGLGRNAVERLPLETGRERVDCSAMSARLRELRGRPVIIVGNAGTVTTGDFDDLQTLADLAQESGASFHVDGAFGLFARVSPDYFELAKGVERADTIASDAHKWLNVPYDSGLIFSRHLDHQTEFFKNESTYLPSPEVNPLNYPNLVPENSRRLRALAAWATLQAYGRDGYRRFVERCCALAAALGERLSREPGFKLMMPVRLNVVCFQLIEDGRPVGSADTKAFIDALIADGRVRISSSVFEGQSCLRLAILNWRTSSEDLKIAMSAFVDCRDLVLSRSEPFA